MFPGKFSYKRELLPGDGQYCPPDNVLLPPRKLSESQITKSLIDFMNVINIYLEVKIAVI